MTGTMQGTNPAPPRPLRVAALTGGQRVPSARFRVRALKPELAANNITLNEYVPRIPKYPPQNKWLRPLWLPAAMAARLPGIVGSRTHDVTLLQRELISTLFTLEKLTGTPRVLDVDDAIFMHREGKSARRLAQSCDLVLAGNPFLADWFSQWNSNVELLPTGIDTNRFTPTAKHQSQTSATEIVVGWTGSQTNLRYLQLIEPALLRVLRARPHARLEIVCDEPPNLPTLPATQLRHTRWTSANEAQDVQQFDIGIMPLADGDWERGKCAFKLLQYMACGKPVVASPVGVNAQLLADQRIGYAATDNTSWEDALTTLIDDTQLREQQGNAGRVLAETHYDNSVIARRMAQAMRTTL